jgi:hypothetical protein
MRPTPDSLRAIFTEMLDKGGLKDHEVKFLSELHTRKIFSDKMWKWFAVLHKQQFGNWPGGEKGEERRDRQTGVLDSGVPF